MLTDSLNSGKSPRGGLLATNRPRAGPGDHVAQRADGMSVGTGQLGANDRPADSFETTALRRALNGGQAHTDVQKINDTWYYRRSVPLTNTMHENCVLCHTNFTSDFFGDDNPGQWVGALVLAVPIASRHDH